MKSFDCKLIYQVTHGIPAAVLFATVAVAAPAGAATVGADPGFTAVGIPPAYVMLAEDTSAEANGPETSATQSKVDRVEERIKDLHTRLQITAEQERQWNEVTQAMRDNAIKMDALTKERAEKVGTMSAVDNLKSYAEIAELHAKGIENFMSPFEDLYESMSDEQKKNADSIFRSYGQKGPDKMGSKSD